MVLSDWQSLTPTISCVAFFRAVRRQTLSDDPNILGPYLPRCVEWPMPCSPSNPRIGQKEVLKVQGTRMHQVWREAIPEAGKKKRDEDFRQWQRMKLEAFDCHAAKRSESANKKIQLFYWIKFESILQPPFQPVQPHPTFRWWVKASAWAVRRSNMP